MIFFFTLLSTASAFDSLNKRQNNQTIQTVTVTELLCPPTAAPRVIDNPGPKATGITTRYWDCCKPSCGWQKNGLLSPVSSCKADGMTRHSSYDVKSSCDGGDAYTCTDYQPFEENGELFGFAAANGIQGLHGDEGCCSCFKLTFTSGISVGKQMTVQVINTGWDVQSTQFDIQVPGGGPGLFDACKRQWGSTDFGMQYGGYQSKDQCINNIPNPLKKGCDFRFDFLGDNPNVEYQKVQCPASLTKKSGCTRQ